MDNELCKLFGVDPFMQWITDEIDYIDDLMYKEQLSSNKYVELMARKQALITARDKFAELHSTSDTTPKKKKIINE